MTEKIEMIQIGSLLFIAFYHFVLYFQIKRKQYLYLSLLVFFVFVRALLVSDGSQLLYELFDGLTRLQGLKIEYVSAYATLPFSLLFIGELFPYKRFQKLSKVLIYLGFALILFVIFTPLSVYRVTLNIYHVGMLVAFGVVFGLVIQAIKSRQVGAKYILWGIVFCFLFVSVEMLKNSRIVPYFETIGPNLANTGLMFFFFFQSIALSFIYAKSFRENELLNKYLESRVSERTEELSQSNVVKERFIRIVSHDLRAPLASLKSTLGLIQGGIIRPEDSETLFKRIDENLSNSLGMLDELMEWTVATSESKFRIFKEDLELGKMVAAVIESFSVQLKAKDVVVKNTVRDGLFISSDRNALKVILRNLLSNAIKFSHPGSEIQISCNQIEGYFSIAVSDSGIGVPNTMKRTIFQMNSRNNRPGTNNEKSTGVGLSICRDLVSQNGGQIEVVDNEPNGSIFKFTVEKAFMN